MKISLSFYRLYFHPFRHTAERQKTDQLTGEFEDSLEPIRNFINSLKVYTTQNRAPSPTPLPLRRGEISFNERTRQLNGIIYVGENGLNADIFDDNGRFLFTRLPDHYEYRPYFFHIDATADKRDIIICIQNFGHQTIRSAFLTPLHNFLKQIYEEYSVKLDPIHLGSIVFGKVISEGVVVELETTSFSPTTNIASNNEDKIKFVKNISPAKRGGEFPFAATKLIRAFSNKILKGTYNTQDKDSIISSLNEIFSTNFGDADELAAIVKFRGVNRKIDLGNVSKYATKYDISEVAVDGNNNPRLASIQRLTEEILRQDIRPLVRS